MIIIDNGHGAETAGKRSPDGLLQEWSYTRAIARMVADELAAKDMDCTLLVPEDADVPLRTRVSRANALCAKHGAAKCRLVSIHVNAAGMGDQWMGARGWSVHVAPNASAASKRMAGALAQSARNHGLAVRTPMPGQAFWVQNLAICRDTRCPAVLVECLFMDNRDDCAYLLTPQGKRTIAKIIAKGL